MEKGMIQIQICMKGGAPILELDGREIESAILAKTKDGYKGEARFIELLDKDYLSVPKAFEQMHIALVTLLKNIKAVDELYDLFATTDAVRQKHFSDYDVIPYYAARMVMQILRKYAACRTQNGALKKTELFTRFLLLRAEMSGASIFGKGVLKDVDAILNAEEKASFKYRLPSRDELITMNYELLTLEMAKAEELMAKPKFIKILKELRLAKAPVKSRKTERQQLQEIITEEQDEQREHGAQTRLAKHQQKKSIKQRQIKEQYDRTKSQMHAAKIAKADGAEYFE